MSSLVSQLTAKTPATGRRSSRRKLGGTVSIVGTDVNEEVVSRALPAITPGTKAKPLRKPLGERTNGATTANQKTRGLDDDAVTGLTDALKTAAKAAKMKADTNDITSKENVSDASNPLADLPADPLERGMALVRMGVDAMRKGGVDPKDALLKLAKKPNSGANVREAASTVVNRLIDTLETRAVDEGSDTSRELDYSDAGEKDSDEKESEDEDVDAEDEEDDSEDVFATATNSPVKSTSGTSDDGGAGIAADDLSAALQGMTVTVEEGVMGCGDETCGSGADGGCDPLECMRRAGGPFKMPAKLVRQPSTVSTARSTPPEDVKENVVEDGEEDEEDEEDGEEEEESESVIATDDEDEDGAEEEEEDDDDDESVADTVSVAGTDTQEESSMADVVAVEAAEEAELAEGSPVMSPGPEVVDVSDLPEGTPIAEPIPDAPIVIDADTDDECDDEVTSKVTPTSAMNATVREKMNASASSDAEETGYKSDDDEAPVSARRTPGRRSRAIVDSDDSDDDADDVKASEEEGSGESPAVGTPPAATTPPARPAFNLAPPTTGKKSILRRIASNRKMRAEREEQEREATIIAAPNFDDAAEAGQPSERSAAAGARAPLASAQPKAFPKSALKKSSRYAAAPASEPEPSEEASGTSTAITPGVGRRRPQRKAVMESAKKKALAWIDDEASDADGGDSGAESDDEACSADDDFVCDDDDVEYDSDASSNAIAEDMHVRSGGIMPNVTPSPERGPKSVARGGPKSILKGRTPGKTPGRGGRLTFGSDDVKHMTDSEGEGSSPEADENRAPRTMVAKGTAQDPFGLDDLKTPTPPRPLAEVLADAAAKTPNWAKTPNTAGRKTVGFGASFGNEPPPTHSKALAAALASAAKPGKTLNYSKHKETIAKALYNEFNNDAFDGKLPAKFDISWNAKLLTTAGLTHYKKVTRSTGLSEYSARIELSTKVLDCAEKLEATLLHEMCHAAAWLLDHQAKPPHGATFKKWANQAMRTYPDVSVDTCHSYEIFQPYRYRCTQQWCNTEYGRHSKSIDVEAKACGVCNGRLEYLGKFNPDGTKAEEKAPTAFSLFVKEHFAATKERLPAGTPHKNIMKELSGLWKSGGNTTGKKTRGGDDGTFEPDALGESMRTLKL